MKSVRSKLIEETINDNRKAIERLSVTEKHEQQINDLIALSLWAIRRLPKAYKEYAYRELISVVERNHPNLKCVNDELEELDL